MMQVKITKQNALLFLLALVITALAGVVWVENVRGEEEEEKPDTLVISDSQLPEGKNEITFKKELVNPDFTKEKVKPMSVQFVALPQVSQVGGEFELEVFGESDSSIGAFELLLQYDTEKITFNEATSVDSDTTPLCIGPEVNTELGTLLFSCAINDRKPVDGRIYFATLRWTALEAGQAVIQIVNSKEEKVYSSFVDRDGEQEILQGGSILIDIQ